MAVISSLVWKKGGNLNTKDAKVQSFPESSSNGEKGGRCQYALQSPEASSPSAIPFRFRLLFILHPEAAAGYSFFIPLDGGEKVRRIAHFSLYRKADRRSMKFSPSPDPDGLER
jgi:hypothetical protein